MRYGFIYETINNLNNKKYIGKHKRSQDPNDPDDSWYLGSGKHLTRAIEKYGLENFSRRIICDCDTEEELQEKERYYIEYYNAVNSPEYYNLVYDDNPPVLHRGENPERDRQKSLFFREQNPSYRDENKEKIRNRMRENNPMSNPATIEKMRDSKIGNHLSDEHKKKLSESHKGIVFSDEHREKLSISQLGKEVSNSTREEISASIKMKYQDREYVSKIKESRKNVRYKKVCAICHTEFLGLSSRSKYCPACKSQEVIS